MLLAVGPENLRFSFRPPCPTVRQARPETGLKKAGIGFKYPVRKLEQTEQSTNVEKTLRGSHGHPYLFPN
jgi:hypothetical protein